MTGVSMRTDAVNSVLLFAWRRPWLAPCIECTNLGRSLAPFNGRHSSATPSLPAIEVNVPHSCTTRFSDVVIVFGDGDALPHQAEIAMTLMVAATTIRRHV